MATSNDKNKDLIIKPLITEKSGMQSQSGVYTFEVAQFSNKKTLAQAFQSLYKVKPVKIGIINLPDKTVLRRGRKGMVSGVRKAVFTLKKGDKIDFV